MSCRAAVTLVLASLACGCGGQTADQWIKEKMFPPPLAALVARIESPKADERREALLKVAADKSARSDPSIVKVFCLVARSDKDPMVRAAAVRGLGEMQGENVLETLGAVLSGDKSPYVRCDAAAALGRQGKAEGAAPLIQVLNEATDVDLRVGAAEALRYIKDKAAAQALTAHVEDGNIGVAQKSWESLRYMTGRDFPRESPPWVEHFETAENPFAGFGRPPAIPKGPKQRPALTKGIGDFFKDLFRKDPREAELE